MKHEDSAMHYTQYFKLTGLAFDVAEAFHAKRDEIIKQVFEYVKTLGASGVRPDRDGKVYSVFFTEVPKGWRHVGGRQHVSSRGQELECKPHRGTKIGKAIAESLSKLPAIPNYEAMLNEFEDGLGRVIQITNRSMHRVTCERIAMPTVSYVVSMPRALNDGLSIPQGWEEISEAEYVLAFHEHNAEVARNNEKETT